MFRPPLFKQPAFWFVVLAQAALCFIAYKRILTAPTELVLYSEYDGAKNYFTPYSYVSGLGEPEREAHPLKVYGQHYPYGEYVFYTDNTPAVSIGLRTLRTLGVHWPGDGVAALSLFFIFCQWLSAVVLFVLLRRLLTTQWLAAAFSVALVWGAKQYMHLNMGSPNLGITAFTLTLLCLCWKLWRQPRSWTWWLVTGGFVGSTAWFHLYYLLLYGTVLAFFAVALLIKAAWRAPGDVWDKLRPIALRAAAGGALAIALIYVPLALIDDKLALRTGEMLGYGFTEWRLDVRSLITPPQGYKGRYILSHRSTFEGESAAYLGMWFWYALTLATLLALVRGVRPSLHIVRKLPHAKFVATLFVIGTLCFFAALGTRYQFPEGNWQWEVIANPFYGLIDVFPVLRHFRAVARFMFVTQWAWSLALLVLIDYWWREAWRWGRGGRLLQLSIVAIVCCAAFDAKDAIRLRKKMSAINLTGPTSVSAVSSTLHAELPLHHYEALLVAPYFHVGAQVDGLIADPASSQLLRNAYTLAAATRLPLINAITSRTPPHEVADLMRFVHKGQVSDSLRTEWELVAQPAQPRPILVAVNRTISASIRAGETTYFIPAGGLAREVVISSSSFAERLGTPLLSHGEYDYYRWDWQTEQQ